MAPVSLLLNLAFLVVGSLAQSACTGQQYNDAPGYPTSNSGCYPTNYYQTYDLGQTSPSDAKTRCQQYCTNAGGSCQSVVAQVNKAADSNLYSGTCFLYAPGQAITPRSCASPAYQLQGYMKDSTNACFSSSSASASKYCSSYLGIPVSTVTATSTPPVTTTTKTVTSVPIVSQTTTVTPVTTKTVTTTVTTTTGTNTITISSTTSVTTQTTTTVTSTVTVAAKKKRADQKKRAATVPAPACVTSGTPATRLSAACSCLSVPTSTTTTTTTLPQVTSTATSTTTIPTTTTLTVTAPVVTSTVTMTTTTGVAATQTTTAVSTSTITQTVTATVTSTTTTAATPTCTAGTYVAATGEKWTEQCNYNYYGGNPGDGSDPNIIAQLPGVTSLNQCIDLCDETFNGACTAVDYYSNRQSYYTPQLCTCLFGTSYGGNVVNGIDSAYLVTN